MSVKKKTNEEKIVEALQNYDVESHIDKIIDKDLNVIRYICHLMNMNIYHVFLPLTIRQLVDVRKFILRWMLMNRKNYTLDKIASILCVKPRDHSSLIRNNQELTKLLETDKKYQEIWNKIEEYGTTKKIN